MIDGCETLIVEAIGGEDDIGRDEKDCTVDGEIEGRTR